ncbi:MAG: hypothetical protein QXY55_00090 [Candidatus Korarchaeota archaeon]|nr:hypothetical protein [Thermoproteota archaeon]
MVESSDYYINLRQKVLSKLRERLSEMESLLENATLILGKAMIHPVDLTVVESIVRLLDFKYRALFSDLEFMDVIAVDGELWFDIKVSIIEKLNPMMEEMSRMFSRLSALFSVPEVFPDNIPHETVTELKEKLRELLGDMLKTVRGFKTYTPKMLPEDKIKRRIEDLR